MSKKLLLIACALMLGFILPTSVATAQVSWNYCQGLEGWQMLNQSPVSWDADTQRMIVTQPATGDGYDPHVGVTGISLDGPANPYLAMQLSVSGAPDQFNVGVFSFDLREDNSWRNVYRNGFNIPGNGDHIIRIDYTNGLAVLAIGDENPYGTEDINMLRIDFPDNAGFDAFQNLVISVDWIAMTDDPDFVPDICPTLVNISGPGMAVYDENVVLSANVTTSEGDVSYQWWKDGIELDGEIFSTLELLMVEEGDSGVYSVEVTDDKGTWTASFSLIVVEALPVNTLLIVALLSVMLLLAGAYTLRRVKA